MVRQKPMKSACVMHGGEKVEAQPISTDNCSKHRFITSYYHKCDCVLPFG